MAIIVLSIAAVLAACTNVVCDFWTVEACENFVRTNNPTGTPRQQVEEWARQKDFTYAYAKDTEGSKYGTKTIPQWASLDPKLSSGMGRIHVRRVFLTAEVTVYVFFDRDEKVFSYFSVSRGFF